MSDKHRVECDRRIDAHPIDSLSARLPIPVLVRLDQLRALADDAGVGRVHQRELLAAIILGADAERNALRQLVLDYRDAVGRDALVGYDDEDNVVEFVKPKSGARPRP